MTRRKTMIGTSAAFVAVILVILLVWFITDDAGRTASTKDPADVPLEHLKPCTADRTTGICYPQAKKRTTFQTAEFDVMMQESRKRSASSAVDSTASSSTRPQSAPSSLSSSTISVKRFRFSGRAFPGTATGALTGSGTLIRSQSGVIALSTDRCRRDRSLLGIFGVDDLTRGTHGWMFPVLLNGRCPITAAMLKAPGTGRGFGGPLNDF